MASSRQQLETDKAALEPVIRGLDDLAVVSLSTHQADQEARTAYKRRRDLINTLLAAMDAQDAAWADLEADGYPTLPVVLVRGPIFDELQEERADLEAALAVFTLRPEVAKIEFSPAVIEDKPIP